MKLPLQLFLACILLTTGVSAQTRYDPDPLRFEADILKFEYQDSLNKPDQGKLLFLGSSSIRFWDSAEVLYENYGAINRGFGGSQISDVLYYFDRLVSPYDPSMIIFYEGDNDINHGKSLEILLNDYKTFLNSLTQFNPEIKLVCLPAKPSPSRWHLKNQYDDFNAALKMMSDNNDNLDYLDLWSPLIGKNKRPSGSLYISDSLHLNAQGYKIWDEVLTEYLQGE